MAPHFYSKDEELELTVEEIKKILENEGLRAARRFGTLIRRFPFIGEKETFR